MKINNFDQSDNLVNGINLINSSTELSDYQADFAEIPSAYQLYWEAYQAQENYFSKGKIAEAEFLAVKGYFDDTDLSSASIFGGQV